MPPKKPRLIDPTADAAGPSFAAAKMAIIIDEKMSADVMAIIFSFLPPKDIIRARLNRKWRDAAAKTMVPPTNFIVNTMAEYNAMIAMTTALPNLQQIKLCILKDGHKYVDGEDPDPDPDEWQAADTADLTALDIDIISNFRKLRVLELFRAPLNGRYPVLFNFPLLQKLSIWDCHDLKWDLELLAGMPVLKELECYCDEYLTGNIISLRVLKDTLEKVSIMGRNVEGNIMDLADFPHLKELYLSKTTAVRGDIRDIRDIDFPKLEQLTLPKTVYGGRGYEFQLISDGPDLVRTLYLFKKHRPTILMPRWYAGLSEASPDSYDGYDEFIDSPPFYIRFVEAGSRVGYQWETFYSNTCEVNWLYQWETSSINACEVNWLDPEPDKGSSD